MSASPNTSPNQTSRTSISLSFGLMFLIWHSQSGVDPSCLAISTSAKCKFSILRIIMKQFRVRNQLTTQSSKQWFGSVSSTVRVASALFCPFAVLSSLNNQRTDQLCWANYRMLLWSVNSLINSSTPKRETFSKAKIHKKLAWSVLWTSLKSQLSR